MSEYQYYEFLAIDHPLTAKEMAELRALSTRAQITPVSFTNEYHWGNFKGDPAKLMKRYFDAHVYVANWCDCYLTLRLPHDSLARATLQEYKTDDAFTFDATGKHWIMNWSLIESQNYNRFGMEDGHGWMARLSLLREELLGGDLRPLYLGWLASVTAVEIDDDTLEPPVPAGLGQLTGPQQALADFIEIDPDLLTAAAMGSAALQNGNAKSDPALKALTETWLKKLPSNEVTELLQLLLAGEARRAEQQLKARHATWRRSAQPNANNTSRRSVAKFRELAVSAEHSRLQAEAKANAREKAKRKKQREAYLLELSTDFDTAWKTASKHAKRGTAAAYDEACRAIIDLSEAYALKNAENLFYKALNRFMKTNAKRPALVRRLAEAGLWTP